MQVAQAALAVLDIGLDQVTRLAGAPVTLLALGKLGSDEFRAGALHHRLVELRHQLIVELAVAGQEARLEQGSTDRHVRLRLPDAFADRARGVSDLEAEVPQAVQDRFRNRLAPRRLLVRQQKQEIDVGARRQQPAAIPAGRHDRHALCFRRIVRRIEVPGRELIEHADDLVLHEAQPFGAAPALAILLQQPFGRRATPQERGLEALRGRRAQFAFAAGTTLGEGCEFGGNGAMIEQFDGAALGKLCGQHGHRIAEAEDRVTTRALAGLLAGRVTGQYSTPVDETKGRGD